MKFELKKETRKMKVGDIAVTDKGKLYLLVEIEHEEYMYSLISLDNFSEVDCYKEVDIEVGNSVQGYEKIERIINKENLKLVEL